MGNAAKDAIKGALKIGSPSKVAQELGHNVGDSFSEAMTDSLPDAVIEGSKSPANDILPAAIGKGAGNVVVNITVNVSQSNASADDIGIATQRGVEQALRLAGVAS
jgi:hypothetical protein